MARGPWLNRKKGDLPSKRFMAETEQYRIHGGHRELEKNEGKPYGSSGDGDALAAFDKYAHKPGTGSEG